MCLIKECICWWRESWCYQNTRYNSKNYGIFCVETYDRHYISWIEFHKIFNCNPNKAGWYSL